MLLEIISTKHMIFIVLIPFRMYIIFAPPFEFMSRISDGYWYTSISNRGS